MNKIDTANILALVKWGTENCLEDATSEFRMAFIQLQDMLKENDLTCKKPVLKIRLEVSAEGGYVYFHDKESRDKEAEE